MSRPEDRNLNRRGLPALRHGTTKLNAEMSAANEQLFNARYTHIQTRADIASRKARRAHIRALGGIRAALRARVAEERA